uniref:Uncharacterized protein n=1 Tax=Chromera velia CCMP2878 TaxID=1169474 RepID=A0A0G4IG58_9ALVE|eukprot:Cvel_138.t1-p1 / transcript=Cvel_138.t1 / gene=Cvel_138 / organism=Chromera_velia_CCMP2878 / gene_product=hypothetical protein / transcript_product=hypothetical protein / location=Cvel_scaffold9:216770-217093(-) / protein_length=108 / sequence_SO=supercontig / SO=protein_coding / is_pseudo=false
MVRAQVTKFDQQKSFYHSVVSTTDLRTGDLMETVEMQYDTFGESPDLQAPYKYKKAKHGTKTVKNFHSNQYVRLTELLALEYLIPRHKSRKEVPSDSSEMEATSTVEA